jgi:anti-sigma B factor antagonist
MDFKLSTARLDGTGGLLLSVDGELDIATVERLAKPAATVVRSARPLLLDLSGCSFLDSAGLRFVLRMRNALAVVGKPMAVVTDRPQAKKLFSITGVDLSVPIFAQRDEAIAWLGEDGAKGAPEQQWLHPAAGGPSLSFPGT